LAYALFYFNVMIESFLLFAVVIGNIKLLKSRSKCFYFAITLAALNGHIMSSADYN